MAVDMVAALKDTLEDRAVCSDDTVSEQLCRLLIISDFTALSFLEYTSLLSCVNDRSIDFGLTSVTSSSGGFGGGGHIILLTLCAISI